MKELEIYSLCSVIIIKWVERGRGANEGLYRR